MAFGKGCSLMVAFLVLALQSSNVESVTGRFAGPYDNVWVEKQCTLINRTRADLSECMSMCLEIENCNAINYKPEKRKCAFRACPDDIPPPRRNDSSREGYALIPDESWSESKDACIKNNNIQGGLDISTLDGCRRKCVNELGSMCASIDYNPERQKCNLQILRSDSSDYTEPCYTDGFFFSERKPVVDVNWSETKDACIYQNNVHANLDAPTIDACRELCISELGSECASVDYNPTTQKCNLQILRSDSSDYTEPCHADGWYFSERHIGNEPRCDWPNGQLYWPHPSDCHKFIHCTPSGQQEMSCPPGTAWSQDLLTCDHEANTECGKPTPPPAPVCPEPFKMRGDECFFVSEGEIDALNWDESRQKCQDMGADLAMPHDMVDFVAYIKESYPDSKSTIWLGATDREVEQEWKWVTGEPVQTEMWKPWPHNQPSGDGNCMEIHYWPRTDFYMNDWHCNNKGHYACEFDMGGK